MARQWFVPARPARREREAAPALLGATGAGGYAGVDPVDGDVGFRRAGVSRRELPSWTLEKARAYSVAAYRANPMARAIVDTFTSFAVGDSGVGWQASNQRVADVVSRWWEDPRNNLEALQPLLFRDHLLMGELAWELIVGPTSGAVRFSPIDTTRINDVRLLGGNPLWPDQLLIEMGDGTERALQVMHVDDVSGLRTGDVLWQPSWRALVTDRRGVPFMAPVIDHLEAYDMVLSNLVDRTALARYASMGAEIDGDQGAVDEWVKARGGLHFPPSGTIEAHNKRVRFYEMKATVGSFEDTNTAGTILTNVAGGAGLARTWLADPEGANRATSQTMAEPVRRRVGAVQNEWLAIMTQFARFAVDRAVAAGRLPSLVKATDTIGGTAAMLPASQTVRVTGPAIAAADAQVTATVLMNLSTALQQLVDTNILTPEAAAIAAEKGWEQFVGRPLTSDLMSRKGGPTTEALAEEAEAAEKAGAAGMRLRLA